MKRKFNVDLAKKRKLKNITQEQLSDEVHISRSLLAKYENGSVFPTDENLEILSKYFGLNANRYRRIPFTKWFSMFISNNLTKICMFFIQALLIVFLFLPIFKYQRFQFPIEDGWKFPRKVTGLMSLIQVPLPFCVILCIALIGLFFISFSLTLITILAKKNKTILNSLNFIIFITNICIFILNICLASIYIEILNLQSFYSI